MGLRHALVRFLGGLSLGVLLGLAPGLALRCPAQDVPQGPPSFAALMARAQTGDPKAQCDLGIALINGDTVPQNYQAGLGWLLAASQAGFGYAHFVLADLYSRGGAGVPVSDEKTYFYASLAAAAAALPDHYRQRADKLRTQSSRRLSPARLAALQAEMARSACAPGGGS